jgi:DMSO/TMAO reductase YedYZ molybdopterin-dependent catalytic subunit
MRWLFTLLVLSLLCACAAIPSPAPISTTAAPTSPAVTESPTPPAPPSPSSTLTSTPYLDCQPGPVIVPTLPARIPAANELDETTGLHVTGKYQQLDLETYRLKVNGKVDHPLSLTYTELICLPKVTASPVLVCPGFFQDNVTWSGVPIVEILKLARVQPGMKRVSLISADGYKVTIPAEDALAEKNFLAYELEGKPLPILHGFPLRAIFPGQVGGWWIKWLVELVVT